MTTERDRPASLLSAVPKSPFDAVKLAIAGDIGELSIGLPTLKEMAVSVELVNAAEAIVSLSDVVGVEPSTLELLVRLLVYEDRLMRST